MIFHPLGVLIKARIGDELRLSHQVGQLDKEAVVAAGDDQLAVGAGEGVVGITGLVAVADALGDTPGGQIDLVDDLQTGHGGVHQRHIHLLAQAGLPGVEEGGQHTDTHRQAAQYIRHGGAGAGRAGVGPAGGAHQAAHSLADDVIAAPAAVRPVVPEAGDTAVDNLGVNLLEGLIAQPQPLHHAGPEVLQHHIGLLHHLEEGLFPLRGLQIEGDTLLVAVEVHVVAALPVDHGGILPAVVPFAHRLNFNHIRSHVGQHHPAEGAGQDPGQVQYRHMFQRFFHDFSPILSFRSRFGQETLLQTVEKGLQIG